jgi:hypothetical protein
MTCGAVQSRPSKGRYSEGQGVLTGGLALARVPWRLVQARERRRWEASVTMAAGMPQRGKRHEGRVNRRVIASSLAAWRAQSFEVVLGPSHIGPNGKGGNAAGNSA